MKLSASKAEYIHSDKANNPQRQSVASEIAESAQSLANRATSLSECVMDKLYPVMNGDCLQPCESNTKDQELPPLFSDLRNSLQGIASALDVIERAMSRTEL